MSRIQHLMVFFALLPQGLLAAETALDRYVHAADDSFQWHVVETRQGDGVTTIILDMTSQKWRSPSEVDRVAWRHWVTVVVPNEVASDIGFLMIGSGANGRAAPAKADERLLELARMTGSVVAELEMVPNQPLEFHGDGEQRSEDNLVAYTWDQFYQTGDPTWLARAPMTKSAVRAMDAITAVMASPQGGDRTVDRFVVAGGSKRGWTAWMTAATDQRVIGVIPIVIDVLDTRRSMKHHFQAYGFWAPSIGDYVRHQIVHRMDDDRYDEIISLVDPISYVDRLTMPKLVLNAAGDQFFLPDSSRFYWDALKGPKCLRYVPNTDHGMGGSDAFESVMAFHWLLVHDRSVPQLAWTSSNGRLTVEPFEPAPGFKIKEVRLWEATNPIARDFRLETFGPNYSGRSLAANADGSYSVELTAPEQGWAARFIELTLDVGAPVPLKLTTSVQVSPDELPFQSKDPKGETSLTVTCEATDTAAAAAAVSALQQLVAAGAIPAPQLTTEQLGKRIYVNWQPPLDQLRVAAVGMSRLLAQQGCSRFAYQLESGLGATLSPGLSRKRTAIE